WLALFSLIAAISIEFAAFFVVAVVCHGELARTKPHPGELTNFYLWMALGGVIGGALTALASPLLFKDFVEYPLALALVCLLRPDGAKAHGRRFGLMCSAAIFVIMAQPFLASH